MSSTQFPLEEEYKKKNFITPEDIRKLRAWLITQPHLPGDFITDLDLILTYHCCNRSAEVTKQVLDLNFTLKTLFVNLFQNRIIDDKALKLYTYYGLFHLETRAHDDSQVLYCRLLNYDTKVFVFHEAVRAVIMLIDLMQYLNGTWPGFVIVIDLDSVTLSHITRLDIQTVQQFLYFLQEALLVKLKGLHFLNAPSFMDRLMMILRPFMKKDLLDMLRIHQTGSKTLEEHVPIASLPKEAGGEYKTFEEARDEVIEKVKANADFFTAENKKRVVESIRPGRAKTITDIFGSVEGSFKKLDID